MVFEAMCDECKVRPAYRRIVETKNGFKKHVYLCRDCYYKRQKNATIKLMDTMAQKTMVQAQSYNNMAVCSKCRTTEAEFLKTSLVGCERCYVDLIKPILRMVKNAQGGYVHKGKSPYDTVINTTLTKQQDVQNNEQNIEQNNEKDKSEEVLKPTDDFLSEKQKLKNLLEHAVSEEDYEQACAIRDEIEKLDKKEKLDATMDE